jgi:uncharacterized protein YxjI
MIDFSGTNVTQLALHYVGNSGQQIYLSNEAIASTPEVADKLKMWFLAPFANAAEKFEFTHPESLQYNETFNYVSELFTAPLKFVQISQQLARHLHAQSDHPKIKTGDFYVVHFKSVPVENRLLEGVGLFKSENKSGFFMTRRLDDSFEIEYREGAPVHKIDKGCLVINDKQPVVYVVDNQNRGEEARYWKESFLQLKPAADNYHYTKNFLEVTKHFIADHLSDREGISRIDQVKMLDDSVRYFKEKEQFDINEFNEKVFNDPALIQSFQEYGSHFVQHNNAQLSDSFEINNNAVKKQARVFKSVLKLDKNFHIYIHGNRDLIERGYDEQSGKKYYKIYFDEEA